MAIKSFSSSAASSMQPEVSSPGTNIDKLIPVLLLGLVVYVAYKYVIKPQMEAEQMLKLENKTKE